MLVSSTLLIALVILIGATVPSFADEELKQTFTCTAKTFKYLLEAPCSAWYLPDTQNTICAELDCNRLQPIRRSLREYIRFTELDRLKQPTL
jgi:hypothetical protein